MTMTLQTGARAQARNVSAELVERALDAAAVPATIAGGATFVLMLLTRLPLIGGAFAAAQGLLALIAYPVVGFLVAAGLQRFYHGPTRTLLAAHFGLGAALALTAGLALARLLGGLFLLLGGASDHGHGFVAVAAAIVAVVARALGGIVPQLLTGTLLAVLGGFVAFDRSQLRDDLDRLMPKL